MDSTSLLTNQSRSTFSDSSRTGSSSKDEETLDRATEDDLMKDNAASPVDLECIIQTERITKILDEAVYKTKLALCLPNLVQEYKTLHSCLSPQHMDDLLFIFDQYENPLFSDSLLNVAAMEDIKSGDVSLKNRFNPELGHLMYIMNSYPALKPKVEEMVQQMRSAYEEDNMMNEKRSLEYLFALEQFRSLMIRRMTATAAEELATKIHARKMKASNSKLIDKIKEYTKCLKEEQERFEETMECKASVIAKLESELSVLKLDANLQLKKKILDSERQMVLASRSHVVKYEMLKEEEAECRDSYQTALRGHMTEEQSQRARRRKIEGQLQSWLQKYDTEMTDKQQEFDDLTRQYEDELDKCYDLEMKLAEQDLQYIPLMREREDEYQEELMRKMTMFREEHAARVLQTAWRDVLASRAEKKKLKTLLKKQQQEAAIAAAAAAAAEKKPQKKKK